MEPFHWDWVAVVLVRVVVVVLSLLTSEIWLPHDNQLHENGGVALLEVRDDV